MYRKLLFELIDIADSKVLDKIVFIFTRRVASNMHLIDETVLNDRFIVSGEEDE